MPFSPTQGALRALLAAADTPPTLLAFIRHPALDERRAVILEALARTAADGVRYLSLSQMFTLRPDPEGWTGRLETEATWALERVGDAGAPVEIDSGSIARNAPIGASPEVAALLPSAHARLRLAAADARLAADFPAAAAAFLPAAAAHRLGLRVELLSDLRADGRTFCAVLHLATPEHPLLAGGRAIGAAVTDAGHAERLRRHLDALAAALPAPGPNDADWRVELDAPSPRHSDRSVERATWPVRAQDAASAALIAAARADTAAIAFAEGAVHPVPAVTVYGVTGAPAGVAGAPLQPAVDALLTAARRTWLPALRARLSAAALPLGA